MPEVLDQSQLSPLPAAKGSGAVYQPLPQDVKDGIVRAHTLQTIAVDRQTLYSLWRDSRNAPKYQEYVVSVEPVSATRSTWTFGDPGEPDGQRLRYDIEITEDVPGERIAWRSVDTEIQEQGVVLFSDAPAGRGTRVLLMEEITAPGGRLGIAAAALTKRTPRQIVIEDLRHFKELAETGEIPTVVGNSHGPRGVTGVVKLRLYGENNPTPPGSSNLPTAAAPTDTPSA